MTAPKKETTAQEELLAISAMLRTVAALADGYEQYTLLEEPLVRKKFVLQEIQFQQDALAVLLRRMRGEPNSGGTEPCPENATTSKSPQAHGRDSVPESSATLPPKATTLSMFRE